MSYTTVPPASKPRPAIVTVASMLLYAAAALELVSVAVSLASYSASREVYQRLYAGTPAADTMNTALVVGIGIGVGIGALFTASLIVLGVLDARGKNPARITTWVIAGLGVLCTGCGLAGTAASGALTGLSQGPTSVDMPSPAETQRQISEAMPAWQGPVSLTTAVLILLALLVAIVLLALPAANGYFRAEQEMWVPPMYPTGTPAYPAGTAGYPGQPSLSSPPAYPTGQPDPQPSDPGGQRGESGR